MFSLLLDSLPEPHITCNISGDELLLNCTAHFQGSLTYAWKLNNKPHSYQYQELFIPLKHVGTTTKATCIIKFSQTERSSGISLSQCLPEEKGNKCVMLQTQVLRLFCEAARPLLDFSWLPRKARFKE